ncbi:MAG: PAS domain-containing sensor histidine kinase, partial [Opitutaceae bacterium]
LRTSEERLRLMIENAHEYAIFSLDLDRKITSWNPGAERVLGFSEKEVIGKSADIIFTPEDRAAGEPEREIATACETGRASDDRWHKRKDGSRFFAIGAMMVMRDGSGEVIGCFKIMRDQTEKRQADDALEQSRAELWQALQENESARDEVEAASRAKDHFLAVLSHELRTPLTPVLMATHILEQEEDDPEARRETIEMIRRNVKIEAQLIDDLLDVTRIGRGKLEIVHEPVDLHEAVRHAVEVTDGDVDAKKLRLTVSLDAEKHELQGDFTRLQQVVWNLIKNAAKFTPPEGKIHVASRNEEDRFILSVEDTGIGIDDLELAKVFEAFAQGSTDITREYGGLGLGLAIAKAVVEAHDGQITVESEGLGKGATFLVKLPLRKIASKAPEQVSNTPFS